MKNCKHISFWNIYKVINFNKTFNSNNWITFKCDKCDTKCILKWKWYKKMKESFIKKILTYFLWLLPAIILIILVASWKIHFLLAISIIIAFHFVAMYYIINSDRLKISDK